MMDWLESLDSEQRAVVIARVDFLAQLGSKLRRPHADSLEKGIHELRAKKGKVQLRVLYFFAGSEIVLLALGFIKRGAKVPAKLIRDAIEMRRKYLADPDRHTFVGDIE